MKIIAVIPARIGSTRLKNKMLLNIAGKPLVWHTYSNSLKSRVDDVIIATDSAKMKNILEKYECKVVLTSKKHKSGTDRVGEVSKKIKADYYINVQGDEPLIKPSIVNRIVDYLKLHKGIEILTVAKETDDIEMIKDESVVKVVTDNNGNALYFSRSVIPYNRDRESKIKYLKHLGIYCYSRDVLNRIGKLKQSRLEKIEKLEQLRWIENGYNIKVITTPYDTISVDTKKDFNVVKSMIENK